MRSWDGFRAHSGKQQLDERGGGGRGRRRESLSRRGKHAVSRGHIPMCSFRKTGFNREEKRHRGEGRGIKMGL